MNKICDRNFSSRVYQSGDKTGENGGQFSMPELESHHKCYSPLIKANS